MIKKFAENIMYKTLSKSLFALTLSLSYGVALADNCAQAQIFFKDGITSGKQLHWSQAQVQLKKSTSLCNKFDNWYLYGQVEQRLENFTAAASAFEDARKYAENNDQRALAIARYAEVLSQQGQLSEPLSILREARKLHSKPPSWMKELSLSLDNKRLKQPLTVAQITRGLQGRAVKLLQPDAKPSVNITINFEYNSTDVTKDSLQNIEILALALDAETMGDHLVTIVGHSDERGKKDYNLSLSERRADFIATTLINKNPKLKTRLITEGKGEKEPLYIGKSEDIYLLNRRIEVFLK